jgi:hypothetical protein
MVFGDLPGWPSRRRRTRRPANASRYAGATMKSKYVVQISPALAGELAEAASAAELPPTKFIEQTLEATLAERRLERVTEARLGSLKVQQHPALPIFHSEK